MNRTGNYAAFYVQEPFNETNLGVNATRDFCYYRTLRMWKGKESSFPFIDSHNKNYNVRDNSLWSTLQSRLRERLRASKNIVLFLSSNTFESKALKEELEYGMKTLGLPVIVIYPDYNTKKDIISDKNIKPSIKKLWDNVPTFKNHMKNVPTLHIPMSKESIILALTNEKFMINTKTTANQYFYNV